MRRDPYNPDRQRSRWALSVGLSALSAPVILFLPPGGQTAPLFWLTPLLPALVLARLVGWNGVLLALGVGTAALLAGPVLHRPTWTESGGASLETMLLANWIIGLGIGWLARALHREVARAESRSLTDDLTSLPNRRHARRFLEKEFAAAVRGRPLALVLFDLDHFKQYNDRHGHVAGDEALREFSRLLASQSRKMNLAARVGGEEFVCILSGCDRDGARVFADRIRTASKQLVGVVAPVSVSAGIASFHSDIRTPEELWASADEALYAAKRAGRDQIGIAPRPGSPDAVRLIA